MPIDTHRSHVCYSPKKKKNHVCWGIKIWVKTLQLGFGQSIGPLGPHQVKGPAWQGQRPLLQQWLGLCANSGPYWHSQGERSWCTYLDTFWQEFWCMRLEWPLKCYTLGASSAIHWLQAHSLSDPSEIFSKSLPLSLPLEFLSPPTRFLCSRSEFSAICFHFTELVARF